MALRFMPHAIARLGAKTRKVNIKGCDIVSRKRRDYALERKLRGIAERKESERRILVLSNLKKRGVTMQYTGNMIETLMDMSTLTLVRNFAERQRACVHCGESWDVHSNLGAHCPVRENGLLHHFASESFE